MYTKNQLLEDLKKIGINESDTLLVHSSMKSIGNVEGGAETVLDALQEAVCDGMLVLPTHTWATVNEAHCEYNPKKEPACVGILPNLFMKRQGVLRSLHPTHSVAAYSKDSKKVETYIKDEEYAVTPCRREGVYGKLYDLDARILLIGVGLNRNTYMHGVEEWFGISERLTQESMNLKICMPDGSYKNVQMKKHFKPNGISISEYYVKMEDIFLKRAAMRIGKIGDADIKLLSARKVCDITTEYLNRERDIFTYI